MTIYLYHKESFFRNQHKSKDPLRFYVYAYLRSKDSETAKAGTPYYIGKGQGDRAFDKTRKDKPKDPKSIIILESNLSEIGAFALERFYIKWFGRKDLGTGILINRSDGGEGPSGIIVSNKTRRLMAESRYGKSSYRDNKGNIVTCQTNDPRVLSGELISIQVGNKQTEESNAKRREYNLNNNIKPPPWQKGKKHSAESLEKMKKPKPTLKGTGTYKDQYGNKYRVSREDPRVLSGELVGVTKGNKQTEEHRMKNSAGNKGKKRWNNGFINTTAYECPGEGWVRGWIKN